MPNITMQRGTTQISVDAKRKEHYEKLGYKKAEAKGTKTPAPDTGNGAGGNKPSGGSGS